MDEIKKQIEKLEESQEPEGTVGEEVVITIVHEKTTLEPNGDRRQVVVRAAGYDEGESIDAGKGNRMRVRRPIYNKGDDVPKTTHAADGKCGDLKGPDSGESTVPQS